MCLIFVVFDAYETFLTIKFPELRYLRKYMIRNEKYIPGGSFRVHEDHSEYTIIPWRIIPCTWRIIPNTRFYFSVKKSLTHKTTPTTDTPTVFSNTLTRLSISLRSSMCLGNLAAEDKSCKTRMTDH